MKHAAVMKETPLYEQLMRERVCLGEMKHAGKRDRIKDFIAWMDERGIRTLAEDYLARHGSREFDCE